MVVFDNGMAAFGDVEYIIEKLSSIFSISFLGAFWILFSMYPKDVPLSHPIIDG